MLVSGIAVSAFFLWLALRHVQGSELRSAIALADYRMLIPFTACLLAFYWVRTYRWKLLLAHISNVTTRQLFGPVMIGYGANFLLPFQFGEVARAFTARSRTRLPAMPLAFSIVVERLFDFLVILLSLALALTFHRHLPEYLTRLGALAALGVVGLAVSTALFAAYTEPAIRLIGRGLAWLPDGPRRSVMDMLRSGARGMHAILNPFVVLKVALVSVGQWAVYLVCIWLTLYAVGAHVSLPTLLLILALTVLGSSVPNAPGYLGSIQAGYVLALEATHEDAAKGLAASIVFHVIYALTAVGMGLVALRRSRIGLRTIGEMENNSDALVARSSERS